MPVPLISQSEYTIEAKTVYDDKQMSRQPNDVLTNQQTLARIYPNQVPLPVPRSGQKINEDHAPTNRSEEKKFYFPPFNVQHRTKTRPNEAKQTSIFAEKIKNHCVPEPHHDHKHYHKHEYHHLPDNDTHVVSCTDNTCTERDVIPNIPSNHVENLKYVVNAQDNVIIHQAPLQTTKLRVQNICCPKEAGIVKEELIKLPGINNVRVNVLGRVAYISHDQDKVRPPEMLENLNKRHLGASIVDAGSEEEVNRGFPKQLKILLAVLAVQAVLFGLSLGGAMFIYASWYKWVAIVQICSGMLPVLKKCYHAIYHRQIDLNILITVTVIGTLAIQQWIEGAAVVFIFILANFLQEFCFYRVHKTISSLMLTKPSKAVMACTGELASIEDVPIGESLSVCNAHNTPTPWFS